jgi:hypothetical protein
MPRTRPHGKRRWLWLLHLTWIVGAVVVALITAWPSIPGNWRWLLVGVLAYGTIVTPITIAQVLRTYWNAPEAAEKNRQLLARTQSSASGGHSRTRAQPTEPVVRGYLDA